MRTKKGQLTLFIIIAILIIAAALFSLIYFRQLAPFPRGVSAIESYLQDCISAQLQEAAKMAGLQAGYLELPEFEPGSSYMPFSNQLSWLGMAIPYWFYVSGNNIARIQKPSIAQVEAQFADYVNEHINECNLDSFVKQGYIIETAKNIETSVRIKPSAIEARVRWPLTISWGDKKTSISEHKISAKSQFGNLYDTAEKIFEAEQQNLFLENYSIDVLRLYAPVDGIELQCAPKIWKVDSVKQSLVAALEANIAAIKVKGSYYAIDEENKYFEVDVGKNVRESVYFLYDGNMPLKFEVWPSEHNIMKAEPIGIQPGLGILSAIGFCYLPYHFVYDITFPVLVQINSGKELFQFPVLVVIDKSQARNATAIEGVEITFDVCKYRNQEINIFTYDENEKPLEAELYYKCFNQACSLGSSRIEEGKAFLKAQVPQCYNGVLIARAENYSEARIVVSSIESFTANMFLKPRHILRIEPNLAPDEKATINFISKSYSTSVYWPEQQEIELVAGSYNVSVQLFKESVMEMPSQSGEQCIKVPEVGVAGILGMMREECFELDVPAETTTTVLAGGGNAVFDATEAELSRASAIKITAQRFDVPTNINELSDIYGKLETAVLEVELK